MYWTSRWRLLCASAVSSNRGDQQFSQSLSRTAVAHLVNPRSPLPRKVSHSLSRSAFTQLNCVNSLRESDAPLIRSQVRTIDTHSPMHTGSRFAPMVRNHQRANHRPRKGGPVSCAVSTDRCYFAPRDGRTAAIVAAQITETPKWLNSTRDKSLR